MFTHSSPAVPAIPQQLWHLPVGGGLAVPWFTLQRPDGRYHFGQLDLARTETAFRARICQICGRKLEQPLVFVMRDRDIARMISNEPACHIVCARYAQVACPFLTGAMTHYRHTTPLADLLGTGAAVSYGDPDNVRAGKPAEPWNLVYANGYTVITDTAVGMLAAKLTERQILRVRPIGTGGSQ